MLSISASGDGHRRRNGATHDPQLTLIIEIQEVECHAEERSDEASLAGRKSRQAWVETVRSANARFARGDTYLLETN
jgi:hypothetical protein